MTEYRLDLTRGSITGLLIRLSGPIVFSMLMHTLYIMADLYFVGRIGPEAVAAISISGNAFFVIFGLSFIIGTGAMALIAQSFGKNEYGEAARVFKNSIILVIIIGLTASIVGISISASYIKFFGGSGRSLTWGIEYFRVYSISFPILLLIFVIGSCYRGMGDTKTPMIIMVQSTILNIVLDPLLIFGLIGLPAMGVRGAAIASIISQLYVMAVYFYLVFGKSFHLEMKGPWRLEYSIIKRSLSIGVPSGLTYFLLAFNMLITYRVISPYGTEAIASLGIGFRIVQAVYLPVVAISSAMAAITGQNFGAGKRKRIYKNFWNGWMVSSLIMILGTLICWIFPRFLIGVFNSDGTVIEYGVTYLKIMSLGNIVVGTIMVVSSVFQGLGKTFPTLLAAIVDNSLFAVLVLSLPVAFNWGIDSVWWIKISTAFVEMLLCTLWLRYVLGRIPIK